MLKRIICTLIICLGTLLVLSSAALAVYNIWDENRAREAVDSVLDLVVQMQEAARDPDEANKIPDFEDFSSSKNEEVLPDYVLDPNKDLPSVEINGYNYIGTITIPALGLELPVLDDWNYKQLKRAPCRYLGSPYLDNMILCGHNYTSHFGPIKHLKTGDSVFFTDMDGNVFAYTVALVETLPGSAVEQMESGDWALSLFTCTLNSVSRITVRCTAVK